MTRTGDSVYHRKDGLWEARYVKEIDAFGKKKYGSVYGHSKREAREKRQDALDHILLYQKATPTRRITIVQLAQEWLYINQNRVKPSTYQRYQGFLKNHIQTVIGNLSAVYLTTATIHEFSLNRLQTGLSPQTVNSILIFLHACLKYGHRQYQLPLPDFVYLTCKKKEMRVLSKEEQQRLVDYLLTNIDIYKFGVLVALYLTNSEIKFEYYLNGIKSSYPDFIMKDYRDRIHIFEAKSLNRSTDSDIDNEDYEAKVNALREAYLYASKLTGYYFYIPIKKGDIWTVYMFENGIEKMVSKKTFLDFIKK